MGTIHKGDLLLISNLCDPYEIAGNIVGSGHPAGNLGAFY